ncbi:MAG: arsenate reductase ArsC [Armatimonadetes bacterium]|nr:arsenate reductase ArsC [Armatimonadota bacterium]
MLKIKKILFLCANNSCRSQMAEGLANFYGKGKIKAKSAGANPTILNPYAVKVMQEIGIDISNCKSKSLSKFINQKFDYIITLCDSAKQSCPIFPGKAKKLHWNIEDPVLAKGNEIKILNSFRKTREKIKNNLFGLLAELEEKRK